MPIDKTLGYEYINDSSHPLSNKAGKVYVHRIVASERLGRWLYPWEHVHHIDGVKSNNSPENLVVLTASEHSIEEQRLRGNVKRRAPCKVCGKETSNESYCSYKCQGKGSRRFDASKEELELLILSLPMTRIGKMYGVSDNAVKKRCIHLGINLKNRKFSTKS